MKYPFLLILSSIIISCTSGRKMPSNQNLTSDILISNVNIVDVEKGMLIPNQDIAITGNRISYIGNENKISIVAKERIDGSGKFVIPGLWDMHLHTLKKDWYTWQFPLFLANGIIGFREMFGSRQLADSIKKEMQKGTLPFFHFTASGHILDGKKAFWPGSLSASTPTTAMHIVDSLAAANVDFIKVYSFLEPEVFEAIAKRSKEKNIRFAGHVPHRVLLTRASDVGMSSMEHLYGLLNEANEYPDSSLKLTKEYAEIFEEGLDADIRQQKWRELENILLDHFSEKRLRDMAKVLKKNNTYIVPTVVTKRGRYLARELSKLPDVRLHYMSKETQEYWNEVTEKDLKINTDLDRHLGRRHYDLEKKVIRILWEEGVQILAGTDSDNPYAYPGFGIHDELALFVEFGMTPVDALRTATLNPAKYLEMFDSLGSIATGKLADIVLLNGNPLTDISQTKNIHAVLLNGKPYTSADLEKLKNQVLAINSKK